LKYTDGILATGTDTGVGKTRVACWLVRELRRRGVRAGACKPAASGVVEGAGESYWEDARALARALGGEADESLITPMRLREPLAPPVAARREGRTVTLADYQEAILAWEGRCEALVVEGVGGLLCPITDSETLADLAAWWGRPILIVARLGLGTINHTLLTMEAAVARGLEALGVVLNRSDTDPPTLADESNPGELRRRLDVPVWGPILHQPSDEPVPDAVREIADHWLKIRAGEGGSR
jgi:dethiobiotin synthetase